MGEVLGLVVGALLIIVGLLLVSDYRGVTYRMSWLGLRLHGHQTVPEPLVTAVRYKTRVGRAVGLFLVCLGAGGVGTLVARAFVNR